MLDQEDLKNSILELSSSEGRYQKNVYRISELVYCPAKSYYYRVLGRRPRLNGKMLSGTLFHEKLPEIMGKIIDSSHLAFEVECRKDYKDFSIMGHADVVNDDTVYEFKYSASRLTGKLPLNYYLQANAYAHMLNKPNYAVVFVHSLSLDVNMLAGETDDEAFKIVEKQAEEIHNALKEKEAPSGPMYDWECRYCGLKDVCENYRKSLKDDTGELIKKLELKGGVKNAGSGKENKNK